MPPHLLVRKNIADITPQEKAEYVHAIKTLKNTYTPGSKASLYDQFVATHVEAMGLMSQFNPTGPAAGADAAHGNDAFLPWHREFLLEFEALLRLVEPNLTIPYWDWTDPNAIKVMLQDDFLGLNGQGGDITIPNVGVFLGGPVQSGYFSEANGWVLNPDINVNPFTGQSYGSSLLRYLLVPGNDNYPESKAYQDQLLALDNYDAFRRFLEGWSTLDGQGNEVLNTIGLHNYVHGVIGGGYFDVTKGTPVPFGTMANIASSPYDPVFWLLHSNVDRLWAEWQDNRHAGSTFYPSEGQGQDDQGKPDPTYGHHLNDRMWPWDGGQSSPGNIGPGNLLSYLPHFPAYYIVTPADVLDFRKLGYRYDSTPAKSGQGSKPASRHYPGWVPWIRYQTPVLRP